MGEARKDEFIETEDSVAADLANGGASRNGMAEDGAEFTGQDADDIAALAADMERLRAERDEMRDRFLRALADAENARKRGDRDRREAETYGGAKFARDILPVYDNLKRALDSIPDEQRATAASLVEGVELTMRELLNIFSRHGITRIAPAEGDTFDPELHEAMFEAPVPHVRGGGIIQVMTEGFLLHDRLLRPAQVGVSSSPKG